MIPVNNNKLNPKSKKLLNKCIDDGWVSGEGSYVKQFEQDFAAYIGCEYGIAVSSGTTALHLALSSLDIGPGDEVILPASTIASCFFAIWYLGATAVPVDVEDSTYNINPQLIEAAITPKTKAIMPVHLFGRPCDMEAILKIAAKHNLTVIEDAAEAHGAHINEKKVGSFGKLGCFSFYANKIITTGEGGMVVTNDKLLSDKLRRQHSLSHDPERRFTHTSLGFNYPMSNMQGAVGLCELEKVEKNIFKKQQLAATYNRGLSKIPGLQLPMEFTVGRQVYWMYAIQIIESKFGCDRDTLMRMLLNEYGIQTRTFFYEPKRAFKKMNLLQKQDFPVATKIADQGMYLPSGTGTSSLEIKQVIAAISDISKRFH